MTEQTIRSMAKELAGAFYDAKRSDQFRSKDAMCRANVLRQFPDGTVREVPVVVPFLTAYPTSQAYVKGHWPFFVDTARQCLTTMLALPDARISPHMKKCIYDALIEDREKQNRQRPGQTLHQRKLEDA